MKERAKQIPDSWEPEPRWHALIAVLAVGGLYTALPEALIIGPRWLMFAITLGFLIPTFVTHLGNYYHLNWILGFIVNCIVTTALIASVILLISALPEHKETPLELLLSAASLWLTNILVFALWYWRLDAGGPHHRDMRLGHPCGAFLFPQMTLSDEQKSQTGEIAWTPNFIDYLFLAFNTSTAFSPTDAPVLTRWAKILMMIQSLISLTVLALLAARAVNIL